MELEIGQSLARFSVQTKEQLPEINGVAYTLFHEASKARLLYLANDDNNKAFSITFKTPPKDNTGVFHILEHSVLCGSRKFPLKEPFVNLIKSSMQTFLNAMTFPDKTMYPVASTNDQDLINLTDVYMDAVLHPNIYVKPEIFQQEGWHWELKADLEADEGDVLAGEEVVREMFANKDSDPKLMLNGVVYNEMKGVFSDPNSLLYDYMQSALFPDTAYQYESGGAPFAIPDLTYEQFLEQHERHYRLDNSYLTLYGNLDVEHMLSFLDEQYLVPVAAEERAKDEERARRGLPSLTPNPLGTQSAVVVPHIAHKMATSPENACAALGYVIGDVSERTRIVAVDILLDALMGSNEAPLKRALLDAGIADDVHGALADSLLQPFAFLQIRGAKPGAAETFKRIVHDTLTDMVQGGLDHTLIAASLSHAEFEMREFDFHMADGVALSMAALSGWLYDDALACTYLKYEDDFAFLKSALDDNYFEQLIEDVFLQSEHWACVEIVPDQDDVDTAEAERIAHAQASFTDDDYVRIANAEAQLRREQKTPDSPEALATLPHLSLSDLTDAPAEPKYALDKTRPLPCLRHDANLHGVIYTYRYFSLNHIAFEEIPYVSILGLVLSKLATDTHDAAALDMLINHYLGSLTFFTDVFTSPHDVNAFEAYFVVGSAALSENVNWLVSLSKEIMLSTDFTDTDRIRDILSQVRISLEQNFVTSGHVYALGRMASYFLRSALMRETLKGVDFYLFVKALLDDFDARKDELVEKLQSLAKRIFADNTCLVSFSGSNDDYDAFWAANPLCEQTQNGDAILSAPEPRAKNEVFVIPSEVSYVAQGYNRRLLDVAYSGIWAVARRALSYDYLWNEVRVKGGAYGANFTSSYIGDVYFNSYRDPHLDETIARFEGAPDWLENFTPTQSELEGFIVASVAAFDAPQKVRALVRSQDAQYFAQWTPQDRAQFRSEMIATTTEALHSIAPVLREALDVRMICAFGSKDAADASAMDLTKVNLLGE
ncbi:insulinase family protein [Eggerthellaceae bacterium 3-80]|nr:peptidase M16 [bacterium D16-34]